MHSVFFDARVDDAGRRAQIYDGQLFVYSPRPSTVALCALIAPAHCSRSAAICANTLSSALYSGLIRVP